MAFCFSGRLLRANINIVFFCLISLLFVANKFLLLLLATRLSSVGVLERSFMTIVQYWHPLQIHLYSTHLRQWRLMWSPLMEIPYPISVRYWRPTWGQRQTFPYSTTLRHLHFLIKSALLLACIFYHSW